MFTIENEQLKIVISPKGAELQSIFNKQTELEYLWNGDPAFWGKKSPVLFPIIGALKNDTYYYDGKAYQLSRHGFARDMEFDTEKQSATAITFLLCSSEATRQHFPFEFEFRITYSVQGHSLRVGYNVSNLSAHEMYFSVGGHPAFRLPLNDKLTYTDYKLAFDNDSALERFLLKDGLINGTTETLVLEDKKLPLKPSLFYNDAIVLKHINSKQIELFTDKDPHGLKLMFEGFPYFGIWAAKDAPFVCLEPWCGIADNVHHNGQLINKEGINQLAAGATWKRTWCIELF